MKAIRRWKNLLALLITAALMAGEGCYASAESVERLEDPKTTGYEICTELFSDETAAGTEIAAVTEKKTVELRESAALKKSGNAENADVSYLWMGSSGGFESCFGDQLTGVSRQIYEAMASKWGAGKTGDITFQFSEKYTFKTSLSGWRTSKEYTSIKSAIDKAVQGAYDAFIYDHPEVFWLSSIQYSCGMSLEENGSSIEGVIKNVVFQSTERYSGAKSEVASFNKAVSKAVSKIKKSAASGSRYAAARAIHTYLCETVSYGDNTSLTDDVAHTAAGVFLKNQVVVCEGYAKAFKILCDEFHIPCVLVVGFADGAHMWNYVKMDDGLWYLVDVTWDDQEEGESETYFLAGSQSIGFDGAAIGSRRVAYTDFSGANAKSFVLPKLSAKSYKNEAHKWKKVSKTAATCRSYGTVVYRCSDCGQEKTELLEKTSHSWGTYKSNKDATCVKDGTKTASCIYGCGKKKTVTDTGSKLKPRIKLNATSVRLQTGQYTTKVKASGLGKGDSIVSWKSSKTSVVTVKKNGKLGVRLTGKKAGKATVTVTLKSGLKARLQVVVQKKKVATEKITGISKSLTLKKGKKTTLEPVISPITSQEKVTYSSSDKKVATVSSKGVVCARKKGTAVITVKSGKVAKKCKVTVK